MDRFSVVEDFLRKIFPGATVERLHRAGDPFLAHIKPHELGGEMWRATIDGRSFDLGITDEALEGMTPSQLSGLLEHKAVAAELAECDGEDRLWILSRGMLTRARLGESPT